MRSFCSFAALLTAVSGFGCSSDSSSPAKGDAGLMGAGGGGAVLPDGGCSDKTLVPYGTECLDQATATSRCEAESAKQSPGSTVNDVTCGAGCTCTYCASEMQACGTDPDCVAILLCAQAHNCTGAGCYLPPAGSPTGTKGPCQDIIDQSGMGQGLQSYGVALVQFVNGCATKTAAGTGRDYVNREGPVCPAACP
jgi:hypothetical protein